MITRKTNSKIMLTENVQKGQGVRDESFKRLLWFAYNQPNLFYKIYGYYLLVGSWKGFMDFISLLDGGKTTYQ